MRPILFLTTFFLFVGGAFFFLSSDKAISLALSFLSAGNWGHLRRLYEKETAKVDHKRTMSPYAQFNYTKMDKKVWSVIKFITGK